jgi:GDPmannose 4,6-dehydratase
MLRRVVIVGIGGQDGSLLKQSLERQGVDVVGVTRQAVLRQGTSMAGFTAGFSVNRLEAVERLMKEFQPDEVYYLAAHHASSESHNGTDHPDNFEPFYQTHVKGFLNFLWAINQYSRQTRIFYAASSLLFDGSIGPIQNELTPFSPIGYYGLSKTQGVGLCQHFRKSHGIHASSGILYSHESVLRKEAFLSKKLIKAAHQISLGQRDTLQVGSLQAQNDWGYAPDYVEAFQLIVRADTPDDFVVATGETHTVAEFAQIVFACFGLDANRYVTENFGMLNRISPPKSGDASKLRRVTGWKPSQSSFQSMVETLVADYLFSIAEPAAS